MNPPFTVSQFLEVFADYNTSVFPVQIIFYAVALFIVISAYLKKYSLFSMLAASFFWLWMGAIYHIAFFSSINKAAYVFGAFFIVQALLVLFYAFRKNISFAFKPDLYGIAGLLMIVYALFVYPVIGHLAGHSYPQSPTLGLPCPTTIFTFGLFLWSDKKFPLTLLVIPFLWSIIGFTAALNFGIKEDIGLLISGILSLILIILKNRTQK